MKTALKRGQIWRNKNDGRQFKLMTKKGDKWRAVQLSDKNHYYTSTHTFMPHILWQKFELLS